MSKSINRRAVLKRIGATGALAGVGTIGVAGQVMAAYHSGPHNTPLQ